LKRSGNWTSTSSASIPGSPAKTGWRRSGGTGLQVVKRPLLEEYVDGLRFLLSIGLDENVGILEEVEISKCADLTFQFLELYNAISNLLYDLSEYPYIFGLYLGLGEMLDFTWEEIEESYFKKNRENHERQNNGY
jgi:dimeric dUTPase (all-alpha-NTP-PPase superfamily)